MTNNIFKIGIFYDGNFVNHVSDFYAFKNDVRSRLSLKGVQEFAINQISIKQEINKNLCKIVDSHLYRNRHTAKSADEKDIIYGERVFDDACMYDGITTHYLPIKKQKGRINGKGTEIWLALDAFEYAIQKKLDAVVLVTSDADFRPLIKKLHAIGTKTILLSWNLEWEHDGDTHVTKTSKDLIEEVNWFVDIAKEYETNKDELKYLFVQKNEKDSKDIQIQTPKSRNYKTKIQEYKEAYLSDQAPDVEYDSENRIESEVQSLRNGYGFILYPPKNIFFHSKDLINCDYNSLEIGDAVEFQISMKPDGEPVAKQIKLLYASDIDKSTE
jgi:uncharacterized LabA/DUF88 family protein/cold shock CspA family protein